MKKGCNKKGAALMWVVFASSILAVLAAGLITLSSYYYNNVKSDTLDMTQSYYNAKSAIETVYSFISAKPSDGAASEVYKKVKDLSNGANGKSIELSLSSDKDGEYATVRITKTSDVVLTITGSSESSPQACTLVARVQRNVLTDSKDTPTWGNIVYID